MHMHICWKDHLDEALYPTLLSYGVTGLRDMGGDLQLLRALKKKAAAKPAGSPYLVGPGPILDGARPIHADASVPLTIGNIEGVLDSLRKNGADFFKVYSLLPKDVLDSVAFYSHKYNMPFAGHVSEYVEPEEAVAIGQRSLEHLNRLEDLGRDTARLLQFIGIANRQQAWFCPTLIIYKRKNEMLNGHFEYNSLYQGLDSSLKAEWEQVKSKMESKEVAKADVASRNERFENQKRLVKTLYNNKVNLLLGTDFAGMQFVYPGYSLHEEMKLLSDIGIANFDILKMGTYNAAAFLGITKLYGTVEVNKMADLVIFNKNPIEDITNSTQIDLVIKAGQIVKR